MVEVIIAISFIIGISAILTILARVIKQPPIIAYLIAGVIVGPLALNLISGDNSTLISTFSHIGVAFLLFIVGLSLDFRVLKEVGTVSTFAGLFEIAVTGGIGFLIAIGIGFSSITALYIGTALAFSSTVVVVKILSDKKEIDTLHGRIALGILIVEDFVAALALMAVPIITRGGNFTSILLEFGIAIVVIIAIFIFSDLIIKRLINYLARNQEVLFLFGIAWALIIAALFNKFGFSLEIGALIAGMSLASSKYSLDLSGKMKPLRDFFIVLFFVFFGSQLSGTIDFNLIKIALLLSVFVVIGKPLIVMTILRVFGYKKRTNFLAGSSIAQISEFSLIIVLLGFNLGHVNNQIMSLAVLVAIFTIAASSYSIYYSHVIFNKISHLLNIFEGKRKVKEEYNKEGYEIILFGYHRIGYKILQSLKNLKKTFAVVDYNPKVILSLVEEKINAIYGDAGDKNFLSELPLGKAKIIISTIPDEGSNRSIREFLDEIKSDAIFIATAEQPRQAVDLYKAGVDYVIIPHHLGGWYASQLIEKYKTDKSKYKEMGKNHLKELDKAKDGSKYYS